MLARVLVIDDDPLICEVLSKALSNRLRLAVDCALNGAVAKRMMSATRFQLAVIDEMLPDGSGTALAEIAAGKNIPSLLMTGHPDAQARFIRFDYPFLAKPFALTDLTAEASRIMAETAENILQVRMAGAKLQSNAAALMSVMAESRHLLSASRDSRARRGA